MYRSYLHVTRTFVAKSERNVFESLSFRKQTELTKQQKQKNKNKKKKKNELAEADADQKSSI